MAGVTQTMNKNFGGNRYATVALMAVREAARGTSPVAAREAAAATVFPDSPAGARKSCPRSAFLALAGAWNSLGSRRADIRNLQRTVGILKLRWR